MWFMVYRMRSYTPSDYGVPAAYGPWSTGNCTVKEHPVLVLRRWTETHHGTQYLLTFYDKLPDDVAEAIGHYDTDGQD